MVAADLRRRGNRILFPYGEDCDYDLVAERPDGRFERVQVKYTTSDGAVIVVRCRSFSLTNGKVRATKKYTASMIDWIGVYDIPPTAATTCRRPCSAKAARSSTCG